MKLIEAINLDLAWKRLKKEISGRNFVELPHEVDLMEIDLKQWFHSNLNKIENERYNPGNISVIDIPKPNFNIRAGAYLYPQDRLFYTALVGACYSSIYHAVKWSNNQIDFSYPMKSNDNMVEWLGSPFQSWSKFRNESLKKLEQGYDFVFVTDVSGFYDNIDLNGLTSDLKSCGCQDTVLKSLSLCLNRWAHVSGRGIPQGHHASDILAKFYLNSVDLYLKDSGFTHLRYVDDIRVFCKSEDEAKRAIQRLTIILRKKGLNLQTSKSKILSKDSAKKEIEGAVPELQELIQKYRISVLGEDDPYASLLEIDASFNPNDEVPKEVLEDAFEQFVGETFNKTLFHFLLKRLGKSKSLTAVPYCREALFRYPEETETILEYVSDVGANSDFKDTFEFILANENHLYPYQGYLILKWFDHKTITPEDSTLGCVRQICSNRKLPFYYRYYAIRIFGIHARYTDFEFLGSLYQEAENIFEQAIILCAMKMIEKGKRNAFYTRAAFDGELQKRAIELVKRLDAIAG